VQEVSYNAVFNDIQHTIATEITEDGKEIFRSIMERYHGFTTTQKVLLINNILEQLSKVRF
jgi:hypothetical protein